jgi:hypothetical protein
MAWLLLAAVSLPAQWGDLGGWDGRLTTAGNGDPRLKLNIEMRTRFESRDGVRFGEIEDRDFVYTRFRAGMTYRPVPWLKLSGMMNDSRAPGIGDGASGADRNPFEMQEGYLELFPDYDKGLGFTIGRKMTNYGDSRLIGTADWGNVSISFDQARLQYRLPRAKLELLWVSPVKPRAGFDQPVLGDHAWGTYNVFPALFGNTSVEAYALRRERNRPGGFRGGNREDGTDRIAQNIFGFRIQAPLSHGLIQTSEGVMQTGNVGPASLRAWGWVSTLARQWTVGGMALDFSGEYKFASGTHNPDDAGHSGTFDSLYSANHDRFGHEDLFGWRNIHNVRLLARYRWTKNLTLSLLYNNSWLASRRDALYTNGGGVVAQDRSGQAGRHVGQEWDIYATYRYKYHLFGTGYGYFFKGDFIRNMTPGVNPTLAYLFHNFEF